LQHTYHTTYKASPLLVAANLIEPFGIKERAQ
jgi:hypothetical protein